MITLEVIVRLGSFQAAADELHKAKSLFPIPSNKWKKQLILKF